MEACNDLSALTAATGRRKYGHNSLVLIVMSAAQMLAHTRLQC